MQSASRESPQAERPPSGASVAVPLVAENCERSGAHPLKAWEVHAYGGCEAATEALLYAMVVFSPWAFGTTQTWSIWTMSYAGYALGGLLAAKKIIRARSGYRPGRWDHWSAESSGLVTAPQDGEGREGSLDLAKVLHSGRGLACVMGGLLAYALVSCLNWRATFVDATLTFEYRKCIEWLPHSLDKTASWFAFWKLFGLACGFWAVRDWLLGKTARDEKLERHTPAVPAGTPLLPERLRRLLWVVAINGALLGVEGIVQRLSGSPKLLFLAKPRIHESAALQFGPYAYRSNAAEYFNLIWPVCLGLWWTLRREGRLGRWQERMLLACAGVTAACPLVSTSRAGALVALGMMGMAVALLAVGNRWMPKRGVQPARLTVFFLLALVLGFGLGGQALGIRMKQIIADSRIRQELYETGRQMARDYPWFGTGPGTYETVSQLYPRPDVFWPAQLHDDWLEFRVTWGWVGTVLISIGLLMVLGRWFGAKGIPVPVSMAGMIWLALAGCMVHARFDFPLQIYSVFFLVSLLAAVLSVVSRPGLRTRGGSGPR